MFMKNNDMMRAALGGVSLMSLTAIAHDISYARDALMQLYDAETEAIQIANWIWEKFVTMEQLARPVLRDYLVDHTVEDEQDLRVRVARLISFVRKYQSELPPIHDKIVIMEGILRDYQRLIANVKAVDAAAAAARGPI